MDLSLLSSSSLIGFLRRKFLMKETPLMILEPLGVKITEASETESAYPDRRGNLDNIQYMVKWKVKVGEMESEGSRTEASTLVLKMRGNGPFTFTRNYSSNKSTRP
ncbi:BnaC03g63930D [Brassica napus]|uniref:BnaC03g63930D protein n=1 Tax=Brassica napus TaxID=3708 RepID=A0A078H0W8_BRANA|nr:BnaC03g63930D [Brassica napus]